jgi:hypothetical protein
MYTDTEAAKTAHKSKSSPSDDALTLDDVEVFNAAREGVEAIKRNFESWVAIGKAVVRAHEIADRRGVEVMVIVKQQKLEAVVTSKQVASKLERIIAHLPQVEAWRREKLSERQRIAWAAPSTIIKHCPDLRLEPGTPRPRTKTVDGVQLIKELQAENTELKVKNAYLEKQRDDVNTFEITGTADEIAVAMVGQLSKLKSGRKKLRDIACKILELLKQPTPKSH